MKSGCLLLLALLGAASGRGEPAAEVIAFNTVGDMLAGDMWDAIYPWDVIVALQDFPADWPVVGLGTTSTTFANGEVLALGTAAQPLFHYCDPAYPQRVWPVTTAMPFLGLAVCDPATRLTCEARPGEELAPQIRAFCQERQLDLAAVLVEGRLREVGGTIAHDLRKSGSPLTDYGAKTTDYLLPFSSAETAVWQVGGLWAAGAEPQKSLSIAGHPLHLHAVRADRSRGGHFGRGVVETATISVYPLRSVVVVQGDATARDGRRDGAELVFTVANAGGANILHLPLALTVPGEAPLAMQLAGLRPGEAREVRVPIRWADAKAAVTVTLDPANAVREADEGNNTLVF
ncbi:MAG: hypothetical protein HUU35_01320 [Armatimonadetes bacterium]|nr:hypothetical protein [Armatimonadota bacterium]